MEPSTAIAESALPSATVVLPPLIGSRPSARELCDHLPAVPGDVLVDATRLISAAQAVADELVAEVLSVRGAQRMTVWGATSRFAEHLRESARLRYVAERLIVSTRQGARG